MSVTFGPVRRIPYHVFTLEKDGKSKEASCYEEEVERAKARFEKSGWHVLAVSETRWTQASDVSF